MDNAVIYTGRPPERGERALKPSAAPLSKTEETVKAYLEARVQLNSADIDDLRAFLSGIKRDTNGLESLSIVQLFASRVDTKLTASELSLIAKRMQLFIFLSYAAALEKIWNEEKSKALVSVGEGEKAQKLIKGSISKDGLSIYHNQSELNNRYRAVEKHKSTIRSLNKTIRSVHLAIENLDKPTASVISAVRIDLGARTACHTNRVHFIAVPSICITS